MIVWDGVFSAAELDAIERLGQGLVIGAAEVASREGPGGYDSARITRVGWIQRGAPDTGWLFARLEDTVLRLNSQYFGYDLSGLLNLQYTIYDADDRSHFDWHQDYGRDPLDPMQEPRKLTLSLQLSDPSDYEGCALEARGSHTVSVAPRARGTLMAFPSYVLHRAAPIEKGQRKALVAWACGPDLR